jgi:gamma-D-glutamyl-L-lysine dipeptidyl-peptidase
MPDGINGPLYGAIDVPLAVFWSQPYEEQVYKDISHYAATNTAAWSENLNTDERLWLVGKVDTTAIFGERVAVLDRLGDWLKVAAVSQPKGQNKQGYKNSLGYPGWVLAEQVCSDSTYLSDQLNPAEAVVSVPKTTLFDDFALTEPRGGLLSYQTRLPILAEGESYLKVRLPDGAVGCFARKEVKKTTKLFFAGTNIVQEARQFLGLKYLWGGTSSYGFDCSGFMFRLYQSQGILIPRDASEQAQEGIPVSKETLHPGDLLFFANNSHPDKIHHVAMYVGEGLMIHSPNSKSAIRIEPFESGVYGEEYWGARRYW